MLNTPILFIIFNRPNHTKTVFNKIRSIKPSNLYIASDGPRNNNELLIVDNLRKEIINQIDWSCNIKTLFRKKNLGCKIAVSSAIDWFFENVENGIIIEDDVLLDESFFYFAEELLDYYENDLRIWQISATNFLKHGFVRDVSYSYYFSFYGSIWGWATWKNRWKYYDRNIKLYDEIIQKEYLKDFYNNKKELKFRIKTLNEIIKGFDT